MTNTSRRPTFRSTLRTLAFIAVIVFSISAIITFFSWLFESRFSEEQLTKRPEIIVITGITEITNSSIFGVRAEKSAQDITPWVVMINNEHGTPF